MRNIFDHYDDMPKKHKGKSMPKSKGGDDKMPMRGMKKCDPKMGGDGRKRKG